MRSKFFMAASLGALLSGGTSPVWAQSQQAQAVGLEEIVVTARKRAESLQDIPVSVTAFTADQIERAGFLDLEDISVQTTGFQFNNALSGSRPGRLFSNMRFRGIEGSEFSTLQTASLFIDGVFVLQGAQSVSLMDLERVEIIKGPQSAQFGRNSFAGAINYITKTPSLDEYIGKIQAEGATYDSYEVQASHEGPLVDGKLAYRVSGRLYKKGAMWTATDGGSMGKQSSKAISAQLYAKPSDSLELKARAYFQKDEDGQAAVAFLIGRLNDSCTGKTVTIDGQTLSPRLFLCGTVPSPGEPGAPKVSSNTSLVPSHPAFVNAGPDYLRNNLLNYPQVQGVPQMDGFGLEREMLRLSLTADYEFENGIMLSITGAYNDNSANDFRDWDMSDLPGLNQWFVTNPQAGDDISADVRLQSPGDERFRWMIGGNYYTQDFITSGNGGVYATACANFALAATEAGFCSAPGIFPVGLDANDYVEAISGYATVSYDITDQLTLDLEARYMNDERSTGGTFKKTYKQFLPRVSLAFKPTDDINIYGNFSRGQLPGVINANIIGCSSAAYTQPFIDPRTGQPSTSSECQQYVDALGDRATQFTPQQKLDAYEIGVKSNFADGRASLNLSVYSYKWKNQPFGTFVTIFRDDDGDLIPNANPNFFPVQAPGSSKTSGAEIEAMLLPADGWNVQANVTYNKNHFTEFQTVTASASETLGAAPNTAVSIRGNRASRFPKWSGNLASTYTTALNSNWDWFVRGDLVYFGKVTAGPTNLATMKSWMTVSTRIGVEREGLRVEFFVKNLFDTDRWAAGQEFTDFTIPYPPFDFTKNGIILVPQDKRQFGIRTNFEF
ncbi:MAG: TonB-dependent receptor [Rhodobacteraceae bacterium]|nr:TonB-dependent receptor [Paracoccaceae bacterium]